MAQLAGRPPHLGDSGNGVLENELILRARFEQQRKLVKALNATKQLCAVNEIDRHRSSLATREIQKTVLNVLRCLF